MKRIFFTFLFIAAFLTGYSQLSNNGGTITVESGATIVIEGDYTSSGTASIEIDGDVQLKGDFVNNGGDIASGSTGTLTFNGSGDQEIGGTNTTNFYCAVVVNKPSGGFALNGANEVLQNALTLTSGKLTLNAYDLTMAGAGITADANNYVVTNNTAGELKALVGTTDVTFPVGTASSYNPVILNNAGTSDTYGVVYTGDLPAGFTGTNHAVDASWAISEVVSGESNLSVTPQWNGTQELAPFERTDCAVGVTADEGATVTWGAFGGALGSNPYTRLGSGFTTVGKFIVGDSFWGAIVINLDLFLAGPYNATTNMMSTDINSVIPNDDPYGNGAFAATIPATAVDWIEVELRDQTNNETTLFSGSYLLDNTGNVMNPDGTAGVKISGMAKSSYYIAVLHRNHFGVMSAAPINLADASPAYNFSTAQNQAWQDAGISSNAAMKEIESGVFGLWDGDSNNDGLVNFIGGSSDRASIVTLLGISGLGTTVAGYNEEDLNMNGLVAFIGGTSDRSVIVNNLGASALGTYISRHLPLP